MKIGDKTFLNLQEAVAWLLENNALPYQSTANYVANTEIAMSTLVNPSPAKVRVGSLIFFADSKVSTVIGVTSNSFIVSDQYNNLVDDIAYVTNVAINASGHLITTLSDGQTIDAGIVKQVSGFSINASQHLIVSFNDGTSTDLGAIFSGNVTISGNLAVTGDITGPKADCDLVTGNEIIEKMSGYSFTASYAPDVAFAFAGVVKTGNKITFAIAGKLTTQATHPVGGSYNLGFFGIPNSIGTRLYPIEGTRLSDTTTPFIGNLYSPAVNPTTICIKSSDAGIAIQVLSSQLSTSTVYEFRYEITFLLSENLAQ